MSVSFKVSRTGTRFRPKPPPLQSETDDLSQDFKDSTAAQKHQKTKKLYQDTRTQRTRNVQEVLGVGEKLDQVSQMSSRLTSVSRIYAEKTRDLNRQALIRKWAPVAIVLGVVFLLFWVKSKLW